MRNGLIKKYAVMLVVGVYTLSNFFQSFSFLDFNKVYAQESQLDYTNLVAVFVDDKIYNALDSDIKRYTQDYIQGKNSNTRYNAISNSKAIVLPVNIKTITAPEITKILENMYFDGISGEPSKLVGVILLGEVPLPVVNQNGFVYPTIYPYVDFEEQKFIWSDNLKYFVYNDNPKGQPEIWHGLINFDSINEYKNYFNKLKDYATEPGEFIGKNIWYDDIIANKQYFYDEALGSYINNFLFAEDIGYKRYNDLMIKIMQGSHNEMISEVLEGFSGANELMTTTDNINTPTLSIEKIVKDGYLSSYTSLIGGKQLDRTVKNVETANRWVEQYTGSNGSGESRSSLDTHYLKIEQKDETLLRINGGIDPLIVIFNQALEDILDQKIEKEKYWLNEVIPLSYLKYDGYEKFPILNPTCTWKEYSAYENYLFGINAKNITNMEQVSSYRGTFRNFDNISGLTIEDIQSSAVPSLDINSIDINKKSIGGSYDIFATQVDANRGYNISNTIQELKIYDKNKIARRIYWNTKCDRKFLGICWRKRRWESNTAPQSHLCDINNTGKQQGCEMPYEFALRNWGGASPLNLSGMNSWVSNYKFQDATMPVFDIAGSQSLLIAENDANSFLGIDKYSRLIQQKFVPDQKRFYTKNKNELEPDVFGLGYNSSMGEDMKFTNRIPTGDMDAPDWKYINPKQAIDVNFFSKFDNNTIREGGIIKTTKEYDNECVGNGEIFTYKTLDSRVKNNSSTKKEIIGTEYKIFEDSDSPSKIFYGSLVDKLERLDGEVTAIIDDLRLVSTGGITHNLNKLKNDVDGINNRISNINNFNLSSLANMNATEIQQIANQWKLAFTEQDYLNIENDSKKIKNQLLDLDGFVGNFGYEYISEYIDDQFYNFRINDRKLIFLNNWKTTLFTKVTNTKSKFNNIKPLVLNAKNKYNEIDTIPFGLSALLLAKKVLLNLPIENNEGQISLGCNSKYASLCNAIDTIRNNLNSYRTELNDSISGIGSFSFQDFDFDGNVIGAIISNLNPFTSIQGKIPSQNANYSSSALNGKILIISGSNNTGLTGYIPGMNMTTSDRPIDSPKYITFKGIGGDKVTFIYPNIYKAEVFTGNTDILELKNPEDISNAIKRYLKESVKKYNQYLSEQNTKSTTLYNQEHLAYNKLSEGDPMANPKASVTIRPYNLISENYLIEELEKKIKNNTFFKEQMGGYEPIEFVSHLIHYQNLGRQNRKLGNSIQENIDNTISDFNINEKISHIVDNYLIKDNDKGDYITPGYRDNGYEVAFINSDGNDYISAKAEPPFVQAIRSAASNFQKLTIPQTEESQLAEELKNECNIPEADGVMIFDISNMSSPWMNALKCRWEKTKKSPFKFSVDWSISQGPVFNLGEEGNSFGEVLADNFGMYNVGSQYMNQLGYLDTSESNQKTLDNSNPVDYQKLEKIISYTKIGTRNQNINADSASGIINISSSIELGNIDFYIKNVGSSIISIKDDKKNISNNITEGTTGYLTGKTIFDPFSTKNINFNIQNPIDGSNVIVFYMCLSGTQNIEKCVKKSLKLNIIPGEIKNIDVITQGNYALQGSSLPIIVKGVDMFGNNVGQLFTDKYEISTSTGTISYQGTIGEKITFSDFSKSQFVLNVDKNTPDNTQIKVNIDGNIGGLHGTYASKNIIIKKGKIKLYQDNTPLANLNIDLPGTNHYSYKDTFDLTQINLSTIKKIKIKLQDTQGNPINIESYVNVSSKNGLIKPGEIEERSITKIQNNMSFEVTQKRFSQKNNFVIKSGELIVYLMPNFKAGEDIMSVSIPGIEKINIPVKVNPAPASIIEINTNKDSISTNSNLKANLKIYDNWGNVVSKDTNIRLGVVGPLNISGTNTPNAIITIKKGFLDFDINSKDKGGNGIIYATLEGLGLGEQKPGNKNIIVQEKMLPEKDLNIMYLNLFGNDRGNQRGFMSENNKYIQKLINNSDKLITTTTQLINPENIKKFPLIISKDLKISNIDENDISLTLDEKIVFGVEQIGEIKIDANNFKIQSVSVSDQNIEQAIINIINNTYSNKNAFIYLPEATDSIVETNEVKNSAILINNKKIFDIQNKSQDTDLSIKLSEDYMIGYQVWELYLGNKNIGKFLIVVNNVGAINFNIESTNPKYEFNKIWIDGSTNKEGIGFYEIDSQLPKSTLGYESIQNSKDPTLGIGFTANFKNITDFGAGKSVGESTINFASEFLINIGDPLLKRIDKNVSAKMLDNDLNIEIDSEFDKGLGETIYSEPGKSILKVMNIDFNNDGLEDIIVAFTDGSVKMLKNYGGNTPFKNLGDLMILSDGIKEIIVGDVDGNGYEDIIIKNNSDIMRVYKNEKGVFDVDGFPICINTNVKEGIKTDTPKKGSGINQIFFEDMNNDGILDIITNDKLGYIKIFYGGKTNGKDNYVSTDKNSCDATRYQRQTLNNNTKIVYRFGIRANENVKVLDKSLIRWKGINSGGDININFQELGIDISKFDNINTGNIESILGEATNFDMDSAVQQYKGAERYKLANFKIIPIYEDVDEESKIEYTEIGCLTGTDPVKIYKQYEDVNGDVLENEDKVKITITIKANKSFTGTFIDNINGPWKIPLTGEMDMIENFWFEPGTISTGKIENELKFHRNMINARYMIDNLSMQTGDEIKINYRVFYDGDVQTSKIDIKDINGNDYEKFGGIEGEKLSNYPLDGLMDIKVQPSDGCNKSMFVLFNSNQGNKKTYTPEYIDLAKLLINFSNISQENLDNAMSSITNDLASNSTEGGANFDNIPGLSSIFEGSNIMDVWSSTFNWQDIVSEGGLDFSDMLSIPSGIIDGLMGDVMEKVDKIMGDMCKGFDLSEYGIGGSENCGLPVPFNQAFLGPGEYHLFGCLTKPLLPLTKTLGKGWPVLNIPGNRPNPFGGGYLPVPGVFGLPFRGSLLAAKDDFLGGPVSGPYPSQFRLYVIPTLTAEIGIAMCFGPHNIGMNIPNPASAIGGNCIVTAIPLPCKDKGNNIGPNITNKIPEAFLDIDICDNQNIPCYVGPGESTSSLEFVSSSNASSNMTLAIPDGSFAGGFINIEKTPITQQGYKKAESGIEINGVKLSGGTKSQNKIVGGQVKGFMKELMQNFIDKQINYIFNNLTNFKIDVALPDFEGIVKGIPELFKKSSESEKEKECFQKGGTWETKGKEKVCTIGDEQKCINKGMEWDASKKSCKKKTNPTQNEQALNKLDARSQNNLLSRDQITNLSEMSFANPFEKMEAMFQDIPLINLRTENITVKVPMISSEDITAYISMSKNWISQQEKILDEWFDLFTAIVGRCGGDENIKNFSDLKGAIKKLKTQLEKELEDEVKGKDNKIKEIEEEIKNTTDEEKKKMLAEEKADIEKEKLSLGNDFEKITKQLEQVKKINKTYDTSALGNYDLFVSCEAGEYLIKPEYADNLDGIIPNDVYISYKPGSENELSMMTQGFDLIQTTKKRKTKIEFKENGKNISNNDVCIKNSVSSKPNQCVDLFLGGRLDVALSNFLNIQSNTTQLIGSVKQNIDNLELYKKFPIDLYEWIHVGDRYMSEIGSLINNFLGTISMRMKTNATRYSQYVDSIILIITTLQTYQVIIDFSKNWSEKCGTCTNDNYDQFTCVLSMLCPKLSLPIFEIPPFKIPSIFIDFSSINLGMDIKLPKFNFVPTAVPLPSLPSIPNPPSFDVSLDVKQALSMGIDLVGDIMVKLDMLDLSISLPAIPIIPTPPDLPQIPSFIPNVKLEMPLLPPAPKIPKIPNEIKGAIDTAGAIGKILCIVKKKVGLVGERDIKAKVEQITQRTYEVPYRDNIDQTLEERNNVSNTKIPGWISDTFGFLKANEFKNVELKGFDIGVESIVNVQFNFEGFYDFTNSIVDVVNKYSSMPMDYIQSSIIDESDKLSRQLAARMSACVSNPVSELCLGNLYNGKIKETKEKIEEMEKEIKSIGNNIKNGFSGVKEALQIIDKHENEKENLEEEKMEIEDNITSVKEKITYLEGDLAITTNEDRIRSLKNEITKNTSILKATEKQLASNKEKLTETINKVDTLYKKYGDTIKAYDKYIEKYKTIEEEYNKLKEKLAGRLSEALEEVNKTIGSGNNLLDDNLKFDKINERNAKIQKQMDDFQKEEEYRKEQRKENINNLYKEIKTDGISYVDYDEKVYADSLATLKEALNMILVKSENNGLNEEIEGYLDLLKLNNQVLPAEESIKQLGNKYAAIIDEIQDSNKNITDLIQKDYNKFLYTVKNNQISLVSDDDINVSLSSNLFEIDGNNLGKIKKQENINKLYMDYYDTNIQGYLNAINTHSPEELNMNHQEYNITKEYLSDINEQTKIAYNVINNDTLISQNNQGAPLGGSAVGGSYVDVSNYINVIKTPEGSINLSNKEYVKKFQLKTIMTDINGDGKNDLIIWDQNSIYVKYRNGNRDYDNGRYNGKYYKYSISSYQNILNNSEDGFVHINDIYVKICDENWEVKNFEYNGGDFDSIKINWSNSQILGDKAKGYLIKMIHRVDLFNDKEKILSNSNRGFFDKKYVLILPKGSNVTGTKIGLEEGIFNTESIISGLILDVLFYNESQNKIDLTVIDLPRNRQYSQIYTLGLENNNMYYINSPSSNQIVAGPQLIGDTRGPTPTIELFRPSIQQTIDEGEIFDLYVSTKYILKSNWEDNVGLQKLRITDSEGDIIQEKNMVNNKTGYIELNNLYYTGVGIEKFYFVGLDTNGNTNSTEVTLNIKKPKIEITDINKYGNQILNITSPATITAEISNDIDEGYVQFLRNRNGKRETITGTVGGVEIDKYKLNPLQTTITGGYYDFGNEIGLYMSDGSLVAKINPKNGKIAVENGFANKIKISLDYSIKTPMIKVSENNGNLLFGIVFNSQELMNITTSLEVRDLYGDTFGDFNNGKAIIQNSEVVMYISPQGKIYVDSPVYGDYGFSDENQSVIYSFRKTIGGENLGTIEIKVKSLLGDS